MSTNYIVYVSLTILGWEYESSLSTHPFYYIHSLLKQSILSQLLVSWHRPCNFTKSISQDLHASLWPMNGRYFAHMQHMPKSSGCRYHFAHNTFSLEKEIWHPGDSAPQVGRCVRQHTEWSVMGANHPWHTVVFFRNIWSSSVSILVEKWAIITFWTFVVSDHPKTSLEIITTSTVCYASESHCTRYLKIVYTPEWHKRENLG